MTDFLSSYCGSSELHVWENGSLSPCFQDSVIWGLLYLYFLVVGTVRVVLLLRKPTKLPPFEWTFYLKTMSHMFLIAFPGMVLLGFFFRDNLETFQVVFYTSSFLIWIYSLLIMNLEYSKSTLHNWVLKSFWTASFLCGALRMQTIVTLENSFWPALVYAIALLAMTILTCTSLFLNQITGVAEDDYHKLSEEERQNIIASRLKYHNLTLSVNGGHYGETSKLTSEFREPSPEESANIISRLTYAWLDPLLKTGNERVLEDQDLYELTKIDTTKYNGDLFQKYWQQELKKEKPSLLLALTKAFGLKFFLAGFLKLGNDILIFVGPFCLNRIVAFIEESADPPADPTPLWVAFLYVFIMTAGALAMSLCQQSYFFITFRVSMQVRAAVVTAVYQKAFKLNNEARQGSTVGEIVNHMSIDSQRLMDLIPYLHQLWSGPLQIIVCLIALGVILGWPLLAGIALMILTLPINAIIIRKLQALQKNVMMKKDQRTRLTNEVLQGIRVIKFFAWENSFRDAITAIRNIEIRDLRKAAYLTSIVMFMWMSTPLFVSIITFTAYTLAGHVLSPTTAFTSLALFNILRFPLNMLPSIISSIINAVISLKRLHVYLTGAEMDPNAIARGEFNPSAAAIIVENGNFIWSTTDPKEATKKKEAEANAKENVTTDPLIDPYTESNTEKRVATLSEIFLNIQPGELVAICGGVGSGKSSLLAAILGDIDCIGGSVEINGRVAYAAQNAWIQNATIRDNILFGEEEDRKRYKKAIRVCQLESDLEVLSDGDQTEIGEKGINLSGGQKQRVSLARAVYNNADIYLLDDPLSAVDAHVGLAIFDQCIVDALKGKTRILVTHQLQHMPKADRIIVLKEGKITELGTYQELISNQGEFAALMKKHVKEGDQEKSESKEEEEEENHEEANKAKNKLMTAEEREVGEVSRQVYKLYAVSLGGFFIVSFLFIFFAMEQLSKVSADWWLSWWSDNPDYTENDWFYIGIYAGIGCANAFFVLSRALVFAYASLNSAKKIHEKLLQNILHTPMSFFDTTPAGRILNRFSKDQYAIDQSLPRTLSMFIVILFASCSILLVIGVVTPFFLTAVIPLTYIYVMVQKFYIRSSREVKRLDSVSKSPIFSHFDETLNGVSTIRAFGRTEDFIAENEMRLDTNQRAFFVNTTANRWLGIRLELLGAVVVGLASLFCVIERDNIDAGSAGLSLTYALQTTSLLNWLVRMYTETEAQMVAVERLDEYSNIPTEAAPIIPHRRPPTEWPQEGEIVFNNLQLRYREGLDLVLKGVSCTIRPKEKIGVVGRTGAGKSTLMLALFRLVEPAGGSITIDGIDICTIGLADLRSRISIIPQDPTLFTGTFRSNLDPFNEFTDENIMQVLDSVHLRDLIESNGGLQADVAEGGGNISVGQRQLMCLGRALLRRSRIIVMDEATASVDFETDSFIQETIRREFADCTVLIIAHRIHTIESCDRVMVLDKGLIAEFDDPNVLKQQESLFSAMVATSGTNATE